MANPKQFTYWTADGKRHWTKFIGVRLPASETLVLEERFALRSRSEMKPATPTLKHPLDRRDQGQRLPQSDGDTSDSGLRSTISLG